MRTAPISSAMPTRALDKTERVTGSSLAIVLLQHERAYTINRAPPPWPDNARGLPELNYGRTLYPRSLTHLLAVQNRRLPPLPVEVRLPTPGFDIALRVRLLYLRLLDRDGGDQAQVHQLYGFVFHPVTIALLVGGMETLFELLQSVGHYRELEGLSPVTQVSPADVTWTFEVLRCRVFHVFEPSFDLSFVRVFEGLEVRAYVVAAQVGDGQA